MNAELYNMVFNKLDSLGAIREDLTFGCEVIANGVEFRIDRITAYKESISSYGYISHKNYVYENEINGNVPIDKIIGHPPVLSDVLKALKGKQNIGIPNGRFYSDSYTLDTDFDPVAVTCKGICEKSVGMWNLSKPFLSEQSDELGEYLLTLLG